MEETARRELDGHEKYHENSPSTEKKEQEGGRKSKKKKITTNVVRAESHRARIFQWFFEFGLSEENVAARNTPEHTFEGRHSFTIDHSGHESEEEFSSCVYILTWHTGRELNCRGRLNYASSRYLNTRSANSMLFDLCRNVNLNWGTMFKLTRGVRDPPDPGTVAPR